MELREVVRKILDEKDWSQEDLGDYLKTSKQNVNGMVNGRPVWELHWQIFLKLLPLIDSTAQKLSSPLAGGLINAAVDKVTSGAQPRRKAGSRR